MEMIDNLLPDSQSSSSLNGQTMQYPDCAVAIIGVACKFAGAESIEQLWQTLKSGTSQCVEIPKHRFPGLRSEQRPLECRFQDNVIDDPDSFDHKVFGVSSRGASFQDPQHRLALEVVYQALESAGHFSREIDDEQRDMGCYIAVAMNGYRENVVKHLLSAFLLTGSIRPFISVQISHYFGLTDSAIALDAACAGSGVAINTACRAVARGECRSAIAGAANFFVSPSTFQDLAYGHFTSAAGPSKPFDAAADGYCRGEGVAAVVVKKLTNAIQDGDVIKGVIMATGANQCNHLDPIVAPHGPSQSTLYRKVLRLAQLERGHISYVEAHETGTRVGDPIEVNSIRAVLGNRGSIEKTLDRKVMALLGTS